MIQPHNDYDLITNADINENNIVEDQRSSKLIVSLLKGITNDTPIENWNKILTSFKAHKDNLIISNGILYYRSWNNRLLFMN